MRGYVEAAKKRNTTLTFSANHTTARRSWTNFLCVNASGGTAIQLVGDLSSTFCPVASASSVPKACRAFSALSNLGRVLQPHRRASYSLRWSTIHRASRRERQLYPGLP